MIMISARYMYSFQGYKFFLQYTLIALFDALETTVTPLEASVS